MHHNKKKVLAACLAMAIVASVQAQEQIVHPDINYAGTPRDLVIGGFNVSGIDAFLMLLLVVRVVLVRHLFPEDYLLDFHKPIR